MNCPHFSINLRELLVWLKDARVSFWTNVFSSRWNRDIKVSDVCGLICTSLICSSNMTYCIGIFSCICISKFGPWLCYVHLIYLPPLCSGKGRVSICRWQWSKHSGNHACMLKFKSVHMHFVETFFYENGKRAALALRRRKHRVQIHIANRSLAKQQKTKQTSKLNKTDTQGPRAADRTKGKTKRKNRNLLRLTEHWS
jgi:hypothetical protein